MRHACPDWDYLVIGPGDPEMAGCTCDGRPHDEDEEE